MIDREIKRKSDILFHALNRVVTHGKKKGALKGIRIVFKKHKMLLKNAEDNETKQWLLYRMQNLAGARKFAKKLA